MIIQIMDSTTPAARPPTTMISMPLLMSAM
jgi:hypothetical protein